MIKQRKLNKAQEHCFRLWEHFQFYCTNVVDKTVAVCDTLTRSWKHQPSMSADSVSWKEQFPLTASLKQAITYELRGFHSERYEDINGLDIIYSAFFCTLAVPESALR